MKLRSLLISFFCLSFFSLSLSCEAAIHSASLAQLGYDKDITVNGHISKNHFFFPLPKADIQAGTISLFLDPSPYLNPSSTFAISLNEQPSFNLTVAQLRQQQPLRLPLPSGAIAARGVSVNINANMFVSNDICADYQRGYLFYNLRNASNLSFSFSDPIARTIPDFFAALYNGLTILMPPTPTKHEIAAAIWLYGALQKSYPLQNMQLSIGESPAPGAALPQIRVSERNHLPPTLTAPKDNLFLLPGNKLVVTADNGEELLQTAQQLLTLPAYAALPVTRSAINVTGGQSVLAGQDRISFGNTSVQEGFGKIAMDFPLYPSQLKTLPKSLNIHLEGRYSPSLIKDVPVRLDVFFNRNLIHSETLDNTGILNKDLSLPESLSLIAKNQLTLEFFYQYAEKDCGIKGPLQNAQIISSSYFSGLRNLNRERLSWLSSGILFNRPGVLLLDDTPSPDVIKAAAQTMNFLNSQLPPQQFAAPEIRFLSEYEAPLKSEYLIALSSQATLPEPLTKGLPLQFGQSSTLYQADGQTSQFSYQNNTASVIGQIGIYQGLPLLAFHSLQGSEKFSQALYELTHSLNASPVESNLYIYNDAPVYLSTLKPVPPDRVISGLAQFQSFIWSLYDHAQQLAGDYYRFLFLVTLVLTILLIYGIINRKS